MAEFRLFRAEAVAFHHDRLRAGGVLPAPPATVWLTWLLLALVGSGVAYLAIGTYARKETVSGFLVPSVGVAKIFPPRTGLVTEVAVTEGQMVQAGDPLLTVKVGQDDGGGSDVDGTVVQSLARQRAALIDQLALEQQKSTAEAARLHDQMLGIAQQVAAHQAELASQHQRTAVAEQQVAAVRDLVKTGFFSVIEFKRREDNFLAQRQNEAALAGQIIERQNEATQQRHALDALPDALAARVSVLRGSIAELESRLAETAGRHAYQLRAPVAGRVSALQARVGLAADPGIPQLAIVPAGSVLQAELLVPARAIGFVAPGQAVRLGYEAFPYQQFGLHGGRVLSVSATLLRPAELVGPIAIADPSYRVLVALDRQDVAAFGRSFALGADMGVKADIVFDRRSLLDWVLEPLRSLRGRAA